MPEGGVFLFFFFIIIFFFFFLMFFLFGLAASGKGRSRDGLPRVQLLPLLRLHTGACGVTNMLLRYAHRRVLKARISSVFMF